MCLTQENITPNFLMDLTARKLFAWEQVYNSYSPHLYGHILRNVPESIASSTLQATFEEIFERVNEYAIGKEHFFTWIYNITSNHCASVSLKNNVPPIAV
jgi:DNA-directed RNA polymerase specialized sigma24 family protein